MQMLTVLEMDKLVGPVPERVNTLENVCLILRVGSVQDSCR